ncbi:DNA mismatch endonuclease (patch repair protein) [Rhizobium mesoamericanum]|uniref:very short patch repair endonuclease n=1 Tax=Rhizobium mesoamericanum TaxID=1079800 RepID=UPI0027818C40|nr:DNA mismatch endonuclease Vsr [Rhizobium mesoamericanum]MDQ0563205.1 DNA mismatch endonuclease (patch repair protein) [Rhizobium mesoamericanum]
MDIVSPARRSQIMARIAGKGTKPEVAVRRVAHGLGYRFRLHRRDLPGSPDLVFPSRQLALFVHGCFWHRHAGCRLAYNPKSNVEFWQAKFKGNIARDARVLDELERLGWRVAMIWECETRDFDGLCQKLKEILEQDGK